MNKEDCPFLFAKRDNRFIQSFKPEESKQISQIFYDNGLGYIIAKKKDDLHIYKSEDMTLAEQTMKLTTQYCGSFSQFIFL